MNQRAKTGNQAEQTARHYLEQRGLKLVEANYYCQRGEIDLIMQDGKTLVFVEVRFRKTMRFGSGAETVDHRKQSKLIATAAHYLQKNPKAAKQACRFDVVSISRDNSVQHLDWIPDAFQSH